MPPGGADGTVRVEMSGALGPAAHPLLRDTLRVALMSAGSPVPGALSVTLTAVTSCDGVLARELHDLAVACAQAGIRLRVEAPPTLLPQLVTTDVAPCLYLADATAHTEPSIAVTPAWVDETTLVVEVAGELDLESTPRMRDDLAVILAARPRRLVLDVTGVRFLASIGVNEIVRLAHAAADDAMVLHVAAGPHNRRTFELLGLADTLLRVFDTRAGALTAFGG